MSLIGQEYWDDKWLELPIHIIPEEDFRYGRYGFFLRMLQREVCELQGKSVIEIGGAGSYRLLALAKWAGARVTALDYSHIGIIKTREIFAVNHCDLEAIVCDFFTWSPTCQYDVVVHWGVLEHFADPVPFLVLCSRLLVPGGKMVFSMPNLAAWGAYFWKKWSPSDYACHTFHSDCQIFRALNQTGFVLDHFFHFDVPMLQATTWETTGIGPSFLSLAQRGMNLISRFIPLRAWGHKHISSSRGFTASLKSTKPPA
jgi:2-polyprenyl-3-methyl-5-hydroxy-6-metoxy-1,4-benzoquinol methylase